MGDTAVKFICTLWGAAVALIATRYLCAAILTAGMNPDEATFQMALNSLGPLLPILSAICLLGGTAFAVVEVLSAIRGRKK